MIGIILGLTTGALFATGSVLARVGQRHRPQDDGLLMTILVNVLVLGAIGLTVTAPEWSTAGVIGLAIGGVLGSLMGRFANLRAVRLVGATRASAFMTGSPVVAAVAGWMVLQEGVELLDAVGGLIVIAGLLALVRARAQPTSMIEGVATLADSKTRRLGFLFAAAAPVAFGLGFVVKKWGLLRYDDAVLGALIGSIAAFTVVVGIDSVGGRFARRVRENFRHIPWWYVAAGVAMSGALITQMAAFSYLDAWLVGVLQGTQGIFALLLSWIFIRDEERIDGWIAASVLLVVAGVILIGLQR
ncbi:MAG TPA: DMT family transporter [Acidimicrobiia bacterium]|nr:DMT family transporter [Acidimicrobiia bacterium]